LKSILGNLRLVCLESEGVGEDWHSKSLEIDQFLAKEAMELAEEAVYFLYSHPPGDILQGDGNCLIARSVVGPKKSFNGEFKLKDWVAAPVDRGPLSHRTLRDMLREAQLFREKIQKKGTPVARPFIICFHRRLKPELVWETEVIFSE
jgi:hypothetical protein